MKYGAIIKEIGRGAKGARDLDTAAAAALFGDILDGVVPELELGAILIAFRIKSEALPELLGFKQAMDSRTAQVTVPDGPRCVVLPTYNGARRQANLMPLVALLLAREGVPVLIQGRHDFETRVSPFELLAALDLQPAADAAQASAQLAQRRLACIGVDKLLPGLDPLLALRLRMGVRASGHTMAKLIDPCRGRSVRVVAVTHPEYLERMDEFLRADGGRAMLMRGTEGEIYA
ncbi:MAG: DNA-binding protein YbiB, partial [Thauera sp.]|nr:DNA-binding protein YbiB [Thauera sp.]